MIEDKSVTIKEEQEIIFDKIDDICDKSIARNEAVIKELEGELNDSNKDIGEC